MKVDLFDYELPAAAIAQTPLEQRDASKLLVLARQTGAVAHEQFHSLPALLRSGDLLVANESRVLPARLLGRKAGPGGARVELLLLRTVGPEQWEVLVKPGRRVPPGTRLIFGGGLLEAQVDAATDFGGRRVTFSYQGDWRSLLQQLGHMPLPPYIHAPLSDPERYQTVYSREEGSAAAPTAGLHFTPALLAALAERGIGFQRLVLHVGLGTFRPVEADEVEAHRMHTEFYAIPPETATAIAAARAGGGRVVAVGTTSLRAMEAAAGGDGSLRAGEGWTDIFIYPGYRFRVADGLITNFHLPRSTLLMLVAAFAGRERILSAYQEALSHGYRFFSFGDAMLII